MDACKVDAFTSNHRVLSDQNATKHAKSWDDVMMPDGCMLSPPRTSLWPKCHKTRKQSRWCRERCMWSGCVHDQSLLLLSLCPQITLWPKLSQNMQIVEMMLWEMHVKWMCSLSTSAPLVTVSPDNVMTQTVTEHANRDREVMVAAKKNRLLPFLVHCTSLSSMPFMLEYLPGWRWEQNNIASWPFRHWQPVLMKLTNVVPTTAANTSRSVLWFMTITLMLSFYQEYIFSPKLRSKRSGSVLERAETSQYRLRERKRRYRNTPAMDWQTSTPMVINWKNTDQHAHGD